LYTEALKEAGLPAFYRVCSKTDNTYRQRTQIEYQNKRYNQKDGGTEEDRGREGGTNFILRIKEQETWLILHEHDDE
jgi:hypothetical protein